MKPRAREADLLVTRLDDELVVCDLARHRTICLSATAARVFRACDGQLTVEEIADLIARAVGAETVDPLLVWIALDKLSGEGLLEGPPVMPPPAARSLARRTMLQKALMTAGLSLALPAVSSILMPTPAYAASCVPSPPSSAGDCCGSGAGTGSCCRNNAGTTLTCKATNAGPCRVSAGGSGFKCNGPANAACGTCGVVHAPSEVLACGEGRADGEPL
jgi:hypothetical protein